MDNTACSLQNVPCNGDSSGPAAPYTGSLTYFFTLSDLPLAIESGADVRPACKAFANAQAVRASGLLPFEFYRAWKALDTMGSRPFKLRRRIAKTQAALTQAMTLSCANAGSLEGATAVLVNTARSMREPLAEGSPVACCDVASVLAATLTRISDDAWVCACGKEARHLLFCGCNVLKDAGSIPFTDAASNMRASLELLAKSDFVPTRIVLVSDHTLRNALSSECDPLRVQLDSMVQGGGRDAWCHAIDLMGAPTHQCVGEKCDIITGWSPEVFDLWRAAEAGTR